MDYVALAAKADALIKRVGLSVAVTRSGAPVASGFGVFVGGEAKNESAPYSSGLASTALDRRSLLLSGLAAPVLVGDVVTTDSQSYTVITVETVRPASTTLLYRIECV